MDDQGTAAAEVYRHTGPAEAAVRIVLVVLADHIAVQAVHSLGLADTEQVADRSIAETVNTVPVEAVRIDLVAGEPDSDMVAADHIAAADDLECLDLVRYRFRPCGRRKGRLRPEAVSLAVDDVSQSKTE